MKTVWIASLAIAASTSALAQSTIYKYVDESGRVTYTNKPMKGAVAMELEPLTTIPRHAGARRRSRDASAAPRTRRRAKAEARAARSRRVDAGVAADARVDRAAAAEAARQRAPQDPRGGARSARRRRSRGAQLARAGAAEPELVAAVRAAQQATDPTPSQLVEMRNNIDKASGRIRGLQATVAEHEKNIEALKRELGALKP